MEKSYLYNKPIYADMWDTTDGSKLDVNDFIPLIQGIMNSVSLSSSNIKSFSNASNAVFEVDGIILKLFDPIQGIDDYHTELYGLIHAEKQGVYSPKVIAHGIFKDSADVPFIVLEKILGDTLKHKIDLLDYSTKFKIGDTLFKMIKKLGVKTENFNHAYLLEDELNNPEWNSFSQKFRQERKEYIKKHFKNLPFECFIHADLHLSNIMISPENKPIILDYGDCCCGYFGLEFPALMFSIYDDEGLFEGFSRNFDLEELLEITFSSTLIHGYGAELVREICSNPECLDDFYARLREWIVG